MKRVLGALNLCVSGWFVVGIVRHMLAPGENVEYTRMLIVACLGTVCISFMLMAAGGPERWAALVKVAEGAAGGGGPLATLIMAGFIAVGVLLPIALIAGLCMALDMRPGFFLVLFFVPVLVRLVTASSQECAMSGVGQALLFFAAILIGAGIVAFLEKHGSGVRVYVRHFHRIWPDYDDMSSARLFFGVASMALINQLIEFICAAVRLVRG